jgi:hypothetical protein
VGVGGDAAADAGARGRRLLQAVDGAVAHRAKPHRRYAGGEQYLINWAKRSKSIFLFGEDLIFDLEISWGCGNLRVRSIGRRVRSIAFDRWHAVTIEIGRSVLNAEGHMDGAWRPDMVQHIRSVRPVHPVVPIFAQ